MEQEQQTKTEQIGELVLLDKKLGEQTTDAFRRYQKRRNHKGTVIYV